MARGRAIRADAAVCRAPDSEREQESTGSRPVEKSGGEGIDKGRMELTLRRMTMGSAEGHAAHAGEQPALFALPEPTASPAEPAAVPGDPRRGARLREADRSQMAWGRIDLDAQLAEGHAARGIWAMVERLNLSALYAPIEARNEVAGAPAIDPKVLLALWVYATSDGEGSAREIWRLTGLHAAYRWICGGVEVGYHTLSDFRSQHVEAIGTRSRDRGMTASSHFVGPFFVS